MGFQPVYARPNYFKCQFSLSPFSTDGAEANKWNAIKHKARYELWLKIIIAFTPMYSIKKCL